MGNGRPYVEPVSELSSSCRQNFVDTLYKMGLRVHEQAHRAGWWENERNVGELLALVHSEVSELLEAVRQPEMPMDEHCPEFTSEEIEAADILIRVLDYAAARGLRLGAALIAKAMYNESRPLRHGGKQF